MTTTAQRATLLAATVATGLAAGFFYAYHVSVTRGLALVDDRTYIDTMQAINATVRNWQFALSFFGALVLGGAALLVRVSRWRSPTTWLVGAAVALYLCAFLITMGLNVPLNEQLAAHADLANLDLAAIRAGYEPDWNRFNALRTLASLAAFACLAAALLGDRRSARSPAAGL
jgi:uncharacterized membrane protein